MRFEVDNVDIVLLENDLVICRKMDTVHYMDKPHFHDGFEIHFTLTNATTYQIDDRRFVADAGSIALFSPEEIHRVSIDRNKLYERYFILFKPNFIEEFTSNFHHLLDVYSNKRKKDCLQLNDENKSKMILLFDELIRAYEELDSAFGRLRGKIKLVEILIFLNELFAEQKEDQRLVASEQHHILSDIVQYMKTNYMDEVNLERLSKQFFISKSTIIRLFKSVLGMTPNQYLIYIRIMKSRTFLEEGYSVKLVSEKVGYKDESSYIKKFKELQGESPKQYTIKRLKGKSYAE